jgi:hypothetical protein
VQHQNHVAVMLVALVLAGGTILLLQPRSAPHAAQPPSHLTPYSQLPAWLAQARARRAPLTLPNARWFVRVRHGHVEVVVQAPAAGLHAAYNVAATGGR